MQKLTSEALKSQFSSEACVSHYTRAAIDIGLWRSEEMVFCQNFGRNDAILELGCGAGRISLGLWELGYRGLIGTDLARPMVAAARQLARKLEYDVPFRVADATQLKFEDEMFDGAIFGFNGLMQIPGREMRRRALGEMRRIVRKGGKLVMTSHDRSQGGRPGFWETQTRLWSNEGQDARLLEFGDIMAPSPHGEIFIHIPTREEIAEDLANSGWTILEDRMRSEIAEESDEVNAFSVDCRFWVVQKPVP